LHYLSSNQTIQTCWYITCWSKVINTYNYDNVSYSTNLEDVIIFEMHTELCINMYSINNNNTDGISYQLGNLKYYKHCVSLLLIYDEYNTKSH
jgi:hypothetical protein